MEGPNKPQVNVCRERLLGKGRRRGCPVYPQSINGKALLQARGEAVAESGSTWNLQAVVLRQMGLMVWPHG